MSSPIYEYPIVTTWIQGTENGQGTDEEFRTYCLINMERAYKLGLSHQNIDLSVTIIADEIFELGKHKFGYHSQEEFIHRYDQVFLAHLKKN